MEDKVIPEALYEMEIDAKENTPEKETIRREQQEIIRQCVESLEDEETIRTYIREQEENDKIER